jgi:outer membrane protein, multidrug efflux system
MRSLVAMGVLWASAAAAEPLELPALIQRARASDPRVKEAQAQLRFYRARYDEARWAWFPHIDSYALVGGPTAEARNNGLGGPPTTPASLLYDLNFGEPGVMFRAGVDAVLPLYTFGKISALQEAGKHGVEAGQALLRGAAEEAELQVSQAYWAYCLAKAGQSVISDTLRRLLDARAALERLRVQGSEQVTQMDVYKLDYYRQQGEAQLAATEAGAGFALAAIRLLVDAAPSEPLEVAVRPLPDPFGALLPVDEYVELAATHRPELKAVEAGLAAQERIVVLRERAYAPDFGLAGFFHWAWTTNTTRQLSPFAYDPYNELNAGLGVVMKYQWDFPQKAAQLEQARAELEKAEHQRSLAVSGVRLEIERLWNETGAALTRTARLAAAEKTARRWATAAYTAFDLGTGDTRELVDSFTALASAGVQRAQAAYDVQVGLKALGRAVGQPVELTVQSPAGLPAAPPP